jgi:hypothetical protein
MFLTLKNERIAVGKTMPPAKKDRKRRLLRDIRIGEHFLKMEYAPTIQEKSV